MLWNIKDEAKKGFALHSSDQTRFEHPILQLMADDDHKGELEDSPAIIALGSLLKLTEIHFWVDLYTGIPYDSTYLECKETAMDEVISSIKTESSSVSVETELSRQMNELGLPLSFCTNKEETLQSHFLNLEAFITIFKSQRREMERLEEIERMETRKLCILMKKP
ncbi:unnamed protein product [Lactuca saligna]|uniref:Uncharacterized protein n=1 Tax=Lactuca saligna TaxID=75948 RepID=A0AA35Y4B2_LACSI|nr:unnamed protein product [Lactuca saligna]